MRRVAERVMLVRALKQYGRPRLSREVAAGLKRSSSFQDAAAMIFEEHLEEILREHTDMGHSSRFSSLDVSNHFRSSMSAVNVEVGGSSDRSNTTSPAKISF